MIAQAEIDIDAARRTKKNRMKRASEKRRLARRAAQGISPATNRAIKALRRELREVRPMTRGAFRAQHRRVRLLYRLDPCFRTDHAFFGSEGLSVHVSRRRPDDITDRGAWRVSWSIPATAFVTQREMWRTVVAHEAAMVCGLPKTEGMLCRWVDVKMAREARIDSGFRPAWGG